MSEGPMETAVQVMEKMEIIMDELVTNAEGLKDISLEGFSEQAVVPLQKRQELLVEQLKGLEAAFTDSEKEGQEQLMAKIGDRIAKKLRYFQHLNAVFIENISEGNFLEDVSKKKIPINEAGFVKRPKKQPKIDQE
jgi:hypothetical protein